MDVPLELDDWLMEFCDIILDVVSQVLYFIIIFTLVLLLLVLSISKSLIHVMLKSMAWEVTFTSSTVSHQPSWSENRELKFIGMVILF